MSPFMYFRDRAGRPCGAYEVDSVDELSVAVIDSIFERRYVIDLSYRIRARTWATCRTCGDHNCQHGEQVERALRGAGLLPGG